MTRASPRKKKTFGNNKGYAQLKKEKKPKQAKPEANESTKNISTPYVPSDDESRAYEGSAECEVAVQLQEATLYGYGIHQLGASTPSKDEYAKYRDSFRTFKCKCPGEDCDNSNRSGEDCDSFDYDKYFLCPICFQGTNEAWEVDCLQTHGKRAHRIPVESWPGDIEWLKAMKKYRETGQMDFPISALDDSDSSQRSYSSQSSKKNETTNNQE